MNYARQIGLRKFLKKIVTQLERIRGSVLGFGYDIIEWKSYIKKVFKEFFLTMERSRNF